MTTPGQNCPHCGVPIPSARLDCPSCKRPVYANEIRELSAEAEFAEREERFSDAMSRWRDALNLMPPASREYAATAARITNLGRQVDGLVRPPAGSLVVKENRSLMERIAGRAGLFGLLLVLLSKIKFLMFGLLKLQTLLSMLLFFGVYWERWGWKFALGFVVSIYIHEMGHVEALRRYGIRASAPMFIPFVGAVVRLNQPLVNRREDARVGLAGPFWGLGASIAAFVAFYATGDPLWGAIGRVGAWINLFNLIPFWQLDGGRGFRTLTREQRWLALAVIGGAYLYTKEGLLLILLGFGLYQTLRKDLPDEADWPGYFNYAGLVVILSYLCTVPLPGVPIR